MLYIYPHVWTLESQNVAAGSLDRTWSNFLIYRFQNWDPVKSHDLADLFLVVAELGLEPRSVKAYISLFLLHPASLFFAFHVLVEVLKSFYFFFYPHVKILIQTTLSWDALFPIYRSFLSRVIATVRQLVFFWKEVLFVESLFYLCFPSSSFYDNYLLLLWTPPHSVLYTATQTPENRSLLL